jgi:chromosome segregation ATPase
MRHRSTDTVAASMMTAGMRSSIDLPQASAAMTTTTTVEMAQLKEDLTQAYKRNSENAREMLQLNGEIKTLTERLAAKERELGDVRSRAGESEAASKRVEDEVRDMEATIAVLRAELQSLQLEFVAAEETLRKTKAENDRLEDRWLKKMGEDAAQQLDTQKAFAQLRERQAELEAQLAAAGPASPQTAA